MNKITTLTALSIGLAAVIPAAHADRGGMNNGRGAAYKHSYGHRVDDYRMMPRGVVVQHPVYVRPPVVPVIVQRPVYVQAVPVYRPVYPQQYYYSSGPVINGGTVVGAIGGAVVGSVIGSQIGYGQYQGAATVAGAVIGGAVGSRW